MCCSAFVFIYYLFTDAGTLWCLILSRLCVRLKSMLWAGSTLCSHFLTQQCMVYSLNHALPSICALRQWQALLQLGGSSLVRSRGGSGLAGHSSGKGVNLSLCLGLGGMKRLAFWSVEPMGWFGFLCFTFPVARGYCGKIKLITQRHNKTI